MRALLLDVEGTTTPIGFVYEVLFPYARARVGEFLKRHAHEAEVQDDLERLRLERVAEREGGAPRWRDETAEAGLESSVAYVHWLMDRDRKSTALKSLQGRIWEEGYAAGALQGEVYPDVPRAFERWRRQGRGIAIYSSGSVLAQKRLFASTPAGDLTSFIAAHFDTTTGPKKEPESYARIAAALGLQPGEVLFVSDAQAEVEAASKAGMSTALCLRSADSTSAAEGPVVADFDSVLP